MNFETRLVGDVTVFKLNEKRLDTSISGSLKGSLQ